MRTLMALRVRPCLVCTGFLFNATPAEVPVPVPRAVQREVVVDRHIPVPHPVPVMQQPVMQQPVMQAPIMQQPMMTTMPTVGTSMMAPTIGTSYPTTTAYGGAVGTIGGIGGSSND